MSNCVKDREELQTLVKDFFEKFLDTWEESDSGKEFILLPSVVVDV